MLPRAGQSHRQRWCRRRTVGAYGEGWRIVLGRQRPDGDCPPFAVEVWPNIAALALGFFRSAHY
jgi:hypothetical protein